MQEAPDAPLTLSGTNTSGAQLGGAEAFHRLESLSERLEATGWTARSSAQDGAQIASLLLEAANLALRGTGRPEVTSLNALPTALAPFHKEAESFSRITTMLVAYSSDSGQEATEQRRQLDTELRSLLERLQTSPLRSESRSLGAFMDWRFWLPWLGVATLCALLGFGWWRLTTPVPAAPIIIPDFMVKVEAVEAAVRAWQSDQSGTLALAPASGAASERLAQTDFAEQLANRLGEKGRWLSWHGPYGAPLDFSPEFGHVELVTIGGSDTVYLSFSGVAPKVWKAVDAAVDHDHSGDDHERMAHGDVLYVPWDKWMAVRLLSNGQRP